MAVILSPSDLTPFADIDVVKAEAMIGDAEALAARVAPCLSESVDAGVLGAARAVLRGAVLRWHESGVGVRQQAGPFALDTGQPRRGMFWPSEIQQLQELCRDSGESAGAFTVDTLGASTVAHADVCSLNFGADYCSCGAVLTGFAPLYEV